MNLSSPLPAPTALIVRLIIGGGVGLAIGILNQWGNLDGSDLSDAQKWRAVTAFALALTAFVAWAGTKAMRLGPYVAWTLIAFLIVGFIGWHNSFVLDGEPVGTTLLILPLLFIAHELVSSGDQARALVAPYETYFEEAWKRGVQLGLAIVFTGLFWAILFLGAALLGFIGFDWLKELIDEQLFHFPATGLAIATAVHAGDIQTKLLSNVRNLVLGVLSWLLPVITVIGTIFAVSLAFSGLAPLWATKAATASLLAACVGFVLLINAAYQDGDQERSVSFVLKWCVRAAALLLLVFAVLAAWSLWLRIAQYGLTPERVMAATGVIIALGYGFAYSAAAVWPGRWMAFIERANIALAFFKVVLFFALLTPIATPSRLAVNDQVNRLVSGKVTPDKFDWWWLKDDAGTYGTKAIESLSKSKVAAIATMAGKAKADTLGPKPNETAPEATAPATMDFSKLRMVAPQGATLPERFNQRIQQDLSGGGPRCLTITDFEGTCYVAQVDLNADNSPEVLILEVNRNSDEGQLWTLAFHNGTWRILTFGHQLDSERTQAFQRGEVTAAAPSWSNIKVGSMVYPANPSQDMLEPAPASNSPAPAPAPSPSPK